MYYKIIRIELLSNSKSKVVVFRKYFDQLLNSEPSVSQGVVNDEEEIINNLENEDAEPRGSEIEMIIKSPNKVVGNN